MVNKYLEKIASNLKEKEDSGKTGIGLLGAGTATYGASVMGDQLSRGHLTGRETLYHGSTTNRINSIKKEGLLPVNKGGISEAAGLTDANKDLVFSEHRKSRARFYGIQQKSIESGGMPLSEKTQNVLKSLNPLKNNNMVATLNLPTWKHGYKSVENPEYRKATEGFAGIFLQPHEKKFLKKELVDKVHVVNSPTGVPSKYIKGGAGYQRNSLSEIREYIRANPSRFAKGVGKFGIGAGLVGAGAYGVKHGFGKPSSEPKS